MVKINKIYTRTGDDGSTGLVGGDRVRKDDPRVECYGTVDETNSFLGVAIVAAESAGGPAVLGSIADVLKAVQHDLFDLGADLATPFSADEVAGTRLRIQSSQTTRLERLIDAFNERLSPLNSFVLPGGSPAAAALHAVRTVTRRAERLVVSLHEAHPDSTNPEAIRYLNRLSDLLFVLARVANDDGKRDVLWVPGVNRTS